MMLFGYERLATVFGCERDNSSDFLVVCRGRQANSRCDVLRRLVADRQSNLEQLRCVTTCKFVSKECLSSKVLLVQPSELAYMNPLFSVC